MKVLRAHPLLGGSNGESNAQRTQAYLRDVGAILNDNLATSVDARMYSSLNAAVDAIGANIQTLIVSDSQPLTASLTIPATLALVVLNGGAIIKASTYTLAINGPFIAAPYQTFSGFASGNVTFGDGSCIEAYPQWWGAKANDSTDCYAGINSALVGHGTVALIKGIYRSSAPVVVNEFRSLYSAGSPNYTTIKATHAGDVVKLNGQFASLRHLKLDGNNTARAALIVKGDAVVAYSIVEDIRTLNSQYGLEIDCVDQSVYWNEIRNFVVRSATKKGMWVHSTGAQTVNANLFRHIEIHAASNEITEEGVFIQDAKHANRFEFININAGTNATMCLRLGSGAWYNVLDTIYTETSGAIDNVQIDAGADYNRIWNLYPMSGGGVVTDNGTGNRWSRLNQPPAQLRGLATLVAGTVVVPNVAITATSNIHLTAQDNNTTGALRVSARAVGVSFTILSTNLLDTGVVGWSLEDVE